MLSPYLYGGNKLPAQTNERVTLSTAHSTRMLIIGELIELLNSMINR